MTDSSRRTEVAVQQARERWQIEREQWQAQIRLKLEKELRTKVVLALKHPIRLDHSVDIVQSLVSSRFVDTAFMFD